MRKSVLPSGDPEVQVSLTATDLTILLWGAESATWADRENEKEHDAACKKLSAALKQLHASQKPA